MLQTYVFSLFLYFPEDKTEYIPAVIWLVAFMILAGFVMRWFIHHSKKESEKTRELEDQLKQKSKNSSVD
ncbi:hypothetical protein LG276_18735 [Cytobacillus kochii]|uniref:hypothetical protein n=1 Tax=Cytobacillus kochii TaxID=859143 RepID=UPI001CD7F69C|nr:hypothetical protein [Cytobacillus kochii]MCA1027751.1 hypothetical protein [Cytobacillus kochii]MCM3324495.1 hypothetical protein [Cytobacillus kochii]MCM3346888.1 hypothetical protein [Cytobacillus kochii]MDM5209020.1 hypothetical protein [Cytobacillus kochii]